MRKIAGHLFDDCDSESVLEHARKLENKTVRQVIALINDPGLANVSGKGQVGQVLQTWFGLDQNDNRPEPDLPQTRFPDCKHVGLEIKVVPMRKRNRDQVYLPKYRSVIGMVNYSALVLEKWSSATVRKKLEHTLFLYYENDPKDWQNSKVFRAQLWSLADEPKRQRIEDDWVHIKGLVEQGNAHQLTERDSKNEILRTCRKGAGGEKERKVAQPRSQVQAWKRAYALNPGHVNVIWLRSQERVRLISVPEVSDDYKSVVLRKLRAFRGRRISELDPKWSKSSKSAAAIVLRKALDEKDDRFAVEQFVEWGVVVRVLPVMARTGKLNQHVSFPAMVLRDFVDEDWETSTLRSYIGNMLFIPTILSRPKEPQGNRIVGNAFFWTPNKQELSGVEAEWYIYRNQVLMGNCSTTRTGRVEKNQLMKASQTSYIHMRPHGKTREDRDVDPHGNLISKQCFWLNKKFVEKLLVSHHASGID